MRLEGHFKPLDFGAEGINGSIDRDGRLIALNCFHDQYGYITLTSAAPFPEDSRYDPAVVRAFRAHLAVLEGFGFTFDTPIVSRNHNLLEDVIPHIQLYFEGGRQAQVTTFVCQGGVLQLWDTAGVPAPRWRGRVSLQRCAYTQLTEGGPIAPPPVTMQIRFDAGLLSIENPALGWAVAVAGLPQSASFEQESEDSIELDLPGILGKTVLAYGMGRTADEAVNHAQRLLQINARQALQEQLEQWRERWLDIMPDKLLRRGLVYGLAMCVPVAAGVCILTDHMLLPLSWNRDAYYVARALLRWQPEMAVLVRQHLLWMFEIANRSDGIWARCYLANGQVKDPAFQLDQQVFPLLELADYVLETGDNEALVRWRPQVESVIEMLMRRKAPDAALFPTDETPADDPIALPYHLSSHILLWYTFTRLAAAGWGEGCKALAEDVRQAIDRYFVTRHPNGQMLYAYAVDAKGQFHFYHDANDMPLALAPVWGMLLTDDSIWKATVDFAFSPANKGGIYHGRLGSVHTPAPWALGDIQEIIMSRALGDAEREALAWANLRVGAALDGALPEAYDAVTGAVVSRHWFAWPNAALACIQLRAFES